MDGLQQPAELRVPGALGTRNRAAWRGGEDRTRSGRRRCREGLCDVRLTMNAIAMPWPPDILERMERAVEKVTERLMRATQTLESSSVPHAVIGGNAVGAWV